MIIQRLFTFSLVTLLLLIAVPSIDAEDRGSRERSFVRALELFDQAKSPADFKGVAQELETILEDGFQNGAVYYNLGNSYYRAGEFGRAILNYRKAKIYMPSNRNLDANLQQAIAVSPGKLQEWKKPWWSHVLFWTDWVAYDGRAWLLFSLLACVAILWTLLKTFAAKLGPSVQKTATGIAVAMLLASVLLAIDVAVSEGSPWGIQRGVIVEETLARKGTADSYEPAFDQPLRDGAEFTILSQTTEWTLGHFEGIGDGWVRNNSIAR